METRKRRGVQAVLLSIAFLLGAITLPGSAAANGPDFDMSVSSGRAGQIVELSSIDPCPPVPSGYDEQYVTFTLIDANQEETVFDSFPHANSSGHWNNGTIAIPWASITQYDPPIYSEEAAIGTGTIQAKCVITTEGVDEYGDPITIHETSQEYVSQPFEVTGSTPTFIAIPTQVEAGESVSTASVDPCFGEVFILIAGQGEFESTQEMADPQTGSWVIELPTHTNNIPFSTGMYRILTYCVPTGQYYGWHYSEAVVQVIPNDHYVVMGDSYSSGTGTFNYTFLNSDCYRSPDGYGFYVADELGIGDPSVVACHGAQTADFYGQNPNTDMPAQLDTLTSNAAYVTLTIGGNDAGFSSVLERCVHHPANQGWGCSSAVTAAQNNGVDVTFVPAALFSGSGLCDTYTPWINEVMLTDPPVIGFLPESLHPTMDGYTYGYGDAFVAIMD